MDSSKEMKDMEKEYQFGTIEQAIADIKAGKMVLVTDDPDRENEGDLIMAADFVTPEAINFMATHAKGLICAPVTGRFWIASNWNLWWPTTRIIMKRPLRFPLIMSIPRQEFRLQNGPIPSRN